MSASELFDPVFRILAFQWNNKLEHARKHKQDVFQRAADECYEFYCGPKNWDDLILGQDNRDLGAESLKLTFKVNVNKAFEFVTIFGPAMYYENPVRTCKPRAPLQIPPEFYADPMLFQMQAQEESARQLTDGLRAQVLETYLNWTPREFQLDKESRQAIDEALIKGRGCLWTELQDSPGSGVRAVRSCWDSVDHLYVDPDAQSFKQAQWIAHRRVRPVWEVEKRFGLRPGSLKGNLESNARQADVDSSLSGRYDRKRGLTNDLIVYWEIWSKMGIGGRMSEVPPGLRTPLDLFGDYCWFVVAKNVPYFLNLPPDFYNDPAASSDPQAIYSKLAWPTPFWSNGEWPVTVLDFHPVFNSPWPMAHLSAGMGELRFLHWVTSFIAGHVRNACRDFVAMKKSLGEEMKSTILDGKDLEILDIEEQHGTITDLVQFLQHPPMNGDIWKAVEYIENMFNKRTGLTELMYGSQGQTQIRSASEANLRNENMAVRPEDMANQVEAWQSAVAAKEAVAARYHLVGQDVAPALGQMGAIAWDQYVHTTDLATAFHELEYDIEAGTTKRPNKEFQVRQMNQAAQTLLPVLLQYATASGDVIPLNNMIADIAKAMDLDPSRYQLQMAPMPPQLPSSAPGQPESSQGGIGPPQTEQPQGGPPP